MADSNPAQAAVQYELLRPAQVIARRQAFPVAYLPLGILEWHGFHNPVGLDALKAHALCIRFAQEIGGLAFPPLWYGENRSQSLMEVSAIDKDQIIPAMQLPPENFAPGYMVESIADQNRLCHGLLVHICHQIKSLGFKVLVICAGHYPLLDHARSAAAFFHQEQSRPKMVTWAMTGYELVKDQFTAAGLPAGDHAGKWETSLLLHLMPGLQDMSALPTDRKEWIPGVNNNGVHDATEDFGRRATEAITAAVKARVQDLLTNHDKYQKHGSPM